MKYLKIFEDHTDDENSEYHRYLISMQEALLPLLNKLKEIEKTFGKDSFIVTFIKLFNNINDFYSEKSQIQSRLREFEDKWRISNEHERDRRNPIWNTGNILAEIANKMKQVVDYYNNNIERIITDLLRQGKMDIFKDIVSGDIPLPESRAQSEDARRYINMTSYIRISCVLFKIDVLEYLLDVSGKRVAYFDSIVKWIKSSKQTNLKKNKAIMSIKEIYDDNRWIKEEE